MLLIAIVAACGWAAVIVGVLAVCRMAARGDESNAQRVHAAAEQQAVPKLTIRSWDPTTEHGRIAASRTRQPTRSTAPAR